MSTNASTQFAIQGGLRALQKEAEKINLAHGFGETGKRLRRNLKKKFHKKHHQDAYARYLGNCLMLIVGEASEAHEEIRHGRKANERYYSEAGKPEGIPSELADIVLRVASFCEELDIDLADVLLEKMTFNRTREFRHGKRY